MGLSFEEARKLGIEKYWPTKAKDVHLPEAPPSRHQDDGMNKTEKRFAMGLDFMRESRTIKAWDFEPERFRLADRTFLKIDFRVTLANDQNVFVETKGGFIRDDAIVKVKVVAEHHPYAFFLAIYEGGRWDIKRLPSRRWGSIDARIPWTI